MKPGIHPTWYPDARIVCACGNTWTTGSTKKETHIDVCNNCHPFFTGEQRIVDTAGQVERFMKRVSAKEKIAATLPPPEDKRAKKDKRDHKPPVTVETKIESPAQLPLAVAEEEKPVVPVTPELPAVETVTSEPVAELPAMEMQPEAQAPTSIEVVSVEELAESVVPAQVEQTPIATVEKPIAEMKPAKARKVAAKKPAAKKPVAKTTKPKAKAAAKPKASVKKTAKPKAAAKKKK